MKTHSRETLIPALFALAFVACSLGAAAAPQKPPLPPQNAARVAEIKAMLRPEAGFAECRVGNRAAWEKIVATNPAWAKYAIGRGAADAARPKAVIDNGEYGTFDYWRKLDLDLCGRLDHMTYAECFEGKGRFIKPISELLDQISAMRTWVIPYHDREHRSFKGEINRIELIGGILTETMARTLDLLRDVLPPDVRARAAKAIWDKELSVYVGMARDVEVARKNACQWAWEIYNWNAACSFYMVSAAVNILDDPQQRAECIELAERSIPFYLSGFTRDGLSKEGASYWDYGFGSYLHLALAVRRATDGKNPFVTDFAEKVMATGFGIRYNDVNAPGFGDCTSHKTTSVPQLTWYLGSLIWPRFACRAGERRGLDAGLFLLEMTRFPNKAVATDVSYDRTFEYPIRTWYEEGEAQLICRPKTAVTNALYAALKGGNNGVSHNHNDVGTYTVAVDGYELACDPGCKEYDIDTFTVRRYETKTRASYGHPVPLVDGVQQSVGAAAAARLVSSRLTDDADEVVLDLAAAYACGKLAKLERWFSYDRAGGRVSVTDTVRLREPGSFEVPIITFGTIAPRGAGVYELVDEYGHRLLCRVAATGGTVAMRPAEDLDFIGKKGDRRARGLSKRYAFAFEKPVTEATLTFTYWLPRAEAPAAAQAKRPFVNDITLPANLYLVSDARNELFFRPFVKRWRPYEDHVRMELPPSGGKFLRHLSHVATLDKPVDGTKLTVRLVNSDEFETVKELCPVLRVGTRGAGRGEVTAQIVGDSLTHGGFYKWALLQTNYVPRLTLVGLRTCAPGQGYEGRGGWSLRSYFDVPRSSGNSYTSYHGFMHPKDGRYWGCRGFWRMAWRCVRGTQPKGFRPAYDCERFDTCVGRFDEKTGVLLDPQAGDVQYDPDAKTMVRFDGKAWQKVNEKSLDWTFDYGKYLSMWNLRKPQFLFISLGGNDFSGKPLDVDYSTWERQIGIFKDSYLRACPGGRFVLTTPTSAYGSDDNAAGDFLTLKSAKMWRFREWMIRTYDGREKEGYYVLEKGLCEDNDYGFVIMNERTAPSVTLPYENYRGSERLRVQQYNAHCYPNYPALGVPLAAFIQYWRDR